MGQFVISQWLWAPENPELKEFGLVRNALVSSGNKTLSEPDLSRHMEPTDPKNVNISSLIIPHAFKASKKCAWVMEWYMSVYIWQMFWWSTFIKDAMNDFKWSGTETKYVQWLMVSLFKHDYIYQLWKNIYYITTKMSRSGTAVWIIKFNLNDISIIWEWHIIDFRYIAVMYNKIVHTAQQLHCQNSCQT